MAVPSEKIHPPQRTSGFGVLQKRRTRIRHSWTPFSQLIGCPRKRIKSNRAMAMLLFRSDDGRLNALLGHGPLPRRRAYEVKFYPGEEGESMRVELWLLVIAGSSHSGFASSALVGKPKLASGARESALGYKPKSGRG